LSHTNINLKPFIILAVLRWCV